MRSAVSALRTKVINTAVTQLLPDCYDGGCQVLVELLVNPAGYQMAMQTLHPTLGESLKRR